jgi:hypothetical protein
MGTDSIEDAVINPLSVVTELVLTAGGFVRSDSWACIGVDLCSSVVPFVGFRAAPLVR